jgi:hypothetical protein
VPTWPVLWAHDADAERQLIVQPDTEAELRVGSNGEADATIKMRAQAVINTASHVHFNYDYQFNAQSLSASYTPQPAIGGRAWPSIKFADPRFDKAFVLWANSTLGLLAHWWQASKSQTGRGSVTLSAIGPFQTLDLRQLSSKQLDDAATLFDKLCTLPLLPLNEIAGDVNRHKIDEKFLIGILGLGASLAEEQGALDKLRRKLGAEPSIRGSKKLASDVPQAGAELENT